MQAKTDAFWDPERSGEVSWEERSRMGLLRGVIDAADVTGRRNLYMHALHSCVVRRELQRVAPVHRALDFGCGTGRFLPILARYSRAVYGVDREPAMVEAARRYSGRYAERIAGWSSGKIDFDDSFFDFILCCSVLSVTSGTLVEPSLAEMARMLQSGGSLLLIEKVARTSGLTLRRYGEALRSAGFGGIRAYPIRSAPSPFTQLVARRPWIPERAFGALAAVELLLARYMRGAGEHAYVQYAIVARRRAP